ncbi:phosphoglycolate phosphatase [Deinobacterium chartae]|uniref:Phosphoglycolate phosphatase n=1 Tax=Deinobacterium chartae TaxID=521158 RepID=A0A841HX64_9DEIO|nr:phosphoglycolate phosphatase [Deinobacterium chartae]
MKSKAIVFDLDGTLVDSLGDISAAFRRAFETHQLTVPEEQEVRALIGKPLSEMYASFVEPEYVERLVAAYRADYAERCAERTRPFPGAVELLRDLRAAGFKTAVATTKITWMARRVTDRLGLTELIDHVQGTDDFPHKPAPDVIHRALEALDAEGLWMVGDTVTDIQAGKAAGLKTYAVSWGTHDAARLATSQPDVLADDLEGLRAALLDSVNR